MKSSIIILFLGLLLIHCNKADSYCELPHKITNAFEFGYTQIQNHALSDEIEIFLEYENKTGPDHDKTLYNFSTPDCFINPKGDYLTDVVKEGKYTYILKDTNTNPGPVTIEIYTFNDCGKSETFSTTINYF
jgi:hypothetical protein